MSASDPTDPNPREVPHALRLLDEIVRAAQGRRPVVFLDYDGTLSPIVDDPAAAVLAPSMRAALEALIAAHPVAVVSGRERADVSARVGIDGIFYAGSHGFDIAGPGGRLEHAGGLEALPELDGAESRLRAALADVPGAALERKRFSLAIHYRRVAEPLVERVREVVEAEAASRPALRLDAGKKVFELKPDVDWHKGRAVEWLLEALGVGAAALPIYVGDDVTDEDAFERLRDTGVTIYVGAEGTPTSARYRLADVAEVEALLRELVRLAPDGADDQRRR